MDDDGQLVLSFKYPKSENIFTTSPITNLKNLIKDEPNNRYVWQVSTQNSFYQFELNGDSSKRLVKLWNEKKKEGTYKKEDNNDKKELYVVNSEVINYNGQLQLSVYYSHNKNVLPFTSIKHPSLQIFKLNNIATVNVLMYNYNNQKDIHLLSIKTKDGKNYNVVSTKEKTKNILSNLSKITLKKLS